MRRFGLQLLLVVNAISFFASAISEMFIHVPKIGTKPETVNFQAFKDEFVIGLKTIQKNRFLTTIISLGTILNFSIAPLFSIGLIFVVKEVLKATDFQFGLFQSILSVFMILAPLISARFLKKTNVGKICYNSFVITGVLIFLLALIPAGITLVWFRSPLLPLVLLMGLSFMVGVAVSLANIAVNTLFQQSTPLELMSRVSTTSGLLITLFIPTGQMLFGFLLDHLTPSLVFVFSGVIFFLAVMVFKSALLEAGSSALESTLEVAYEI